jgi:hypothetical protein
MRARRIAALALAAALEFGGCRASVSVPPTPTSYTLSAVPIPSAAPVLGTQYNLYCSDNGGPFVLVNPAPFGEGGYAEPNATAGTHQCYVTAVSGGIESGPSPQPWPTVTVP